MNEFQDRLARIGLGPLSEHGFSLAGGYALQAHGLVDRLSEDVDLFTDRWDAAEFSQAVDEVVDAYQQEGLDVVVARRAETFARLEVTESATDRSASVNLAADFVTRRPWPCQSDRSSRNQDAVGSKVAAVFSRGYARDYLDLAGILASGRYNRDKLIAMASRVDTGFTTEWFADALAGVDRFSG